MTPHFDAVMILRIDEEGECRILGSGTVIGPRAILTCRHVLESNGKWHTGLHVRLHSEGVDFAVQGEPVPDPDGLDIAVLRTEGDLHCQDGRPPNLVPWSLLLARLTGAGPQPMASRGYPVVVLTKPLEEPFVAHGTVSAPSEGGRLLHVSVNNEFIDIPLRKPKRKVNETEKEKAKAPQAARHARDVARWKGLSGAGIWVGDRVVGVIDSASPVQMKALQGTPVQDFIHKDWFPKALEGDEPFQAWRERCTSAEDRVTDLLKADEVARSTIATRLSLPPTSNAAEVASCLFQSPAQVSLEALDQSDQDLFRSLRNSANTVWAILRELTPWLVDWKQVVIEARGQRDHGLELFVGPLTVAEAILAAADGRGCSFEHIGDTVQGRWWITWPAAMDAVPWTNENFDAAQLQALSQRFGDGRLTRAVARLAREKKVPTHLAMENLLKNLETRLSRAARASPAEREVWSIVIIDGCVRDGQPGHAWALLRNSELGGLLPSLKQVRVCHTDSDLGVEADAYIDAIERRHKD